MSLFVSPLSHFLLLSLVCVSHLLDNRLLISLSEIKIKSKKFLGRKNLLDFVRIRISCILHDKTPPRIHHKSDHFIIKSSKLNIFTTIETVFRPFCEKTLKSGSSNKVFLFSLSSALLVRCLNWSSFNNLNFNQQID